MPTSAELFVPSSPSPFSFRPLTAGMVTSDTTVAMPNGSFLTIDGYDVTLRGPKKHGGWEPALFSNGTTTPLQFTSTDASERIESQTQLLVSDGTSIELVITNRAMYIIDEVLGYRRLNWIQEYTVDGVSQTATETTITLTGDFRQHYFEAGDKFVFGGVDYLITAVTSLEASTTLVFEGIPTIVVTDKFNIFKPFSAGDAQYVDWTISRNTMYLVDGTTRMVWKFTGVAGDDLNFRLVPHIITGLDAVTRTVMGAYSVTAFGERLYFAGIIEQESESVVAIYRNRVRWTEVLNHARCLAASYQDLTRTTGKAVKILGMGSLIMVYMDDSIYYGRATSLTSIPYAFTYIETAGVTALGMKAISTYFDGQVFQGLDNVYYISADVQITPLGDRVSQDLRDHSEIGYMSSILVDTDRSRILVCMSNNPEYIDTVFYYNYQAKAWSMKTTLPLIAPVHQINNDYLYYNEVPDVDTYETSLLRSTQYRALLTGDHSKNLYCFVNGYFMEYIETRGLNSIVVAGVTVPHDTPCILETPDFDFDDPDTEKSALRVSLKISEDATDTPRIENIYFTVEGSIDRGLTWRNLGKMRIMPGHDEDALNFRLTGSTLRFRFKQGITDDATSTDVAPFTISEVVLRLRGRGLEAQRSNARNGIA